MEFIAATKACKEYVLLCDNQSAINLGKNPTFHSRSKHFDTHYHWIHGVLDAKLLCLQKVHINDNSTNMLTKSLLMEKLETCRLIVELVNPST